MHRCAARIRAARKSAGITQKALGQELGVVVKQVQKYETGVNRVSPDRLQKIAMATGKPITYFVDDIRSNNDGNEEIKVIVRLPGSGSAMRRILKALPKVEGDDAVLLAMIVERMTARTR